MSLVLVTKEVARYVNIKHAKIELIDNGNTHDLRVQLVKEIAELLLGFKALKTFEAQVAIYDYSTKTTWENKHIQRADEWIYRAVGVKCRINGSRTEGRFLLLRQYTFRWAAEVE